MEIWKDVIGYEGIYQVSNMGRVKRIKQARGTHVGKVLKEVLGKDGYVYVKIFKEGLGKRYSPSRGVAQAFIPNPENKPQINHKNGIKTFNWVENLEWVTRSENCLHAYRVLKITANQGEKNGQAKLKAKDIPIIRQLLKEGNLLHREIGKIFGVRRATIDDIKNGYAWTHI